MGCMDNLINKIPQVDQCCCGCDLSTGAKFVAWLQIVFGVIVELMLGAGVATFSAAIGHINKDDPNRDNAALVLIISIVMLVFVMLLVLIALIMGFILLTGVNKNDMAKVRCWLNVTVILFIIGVTFTLLGFVGMVTKQPGQAIGQLISSIISYGIELYFIAVVKSYYTSQVTSFQQVSVSP